VLHVEDLISPNQDSLVVTDHSVVQVEQSVLCVCLSVRMINSWTKWPLI